MATRDSDKARADKMAAVLGVAAGLGAFHPATRLPATILGSMILPIYGMHSSFGSESPEDNVPNQPDDFGNYYGPNGERLDAETGRRVDEMTDRVINAGWY